MTISSDFHDLDDNLKLPDADRARAIEVHNEISSMLSTAGVATRTRLQGSFARKTMRAPLRDIDKIIELPADRWDELNKPGGPAAAMDLIRDVLAPSLPLAHFAVKKHALAIELPDERFDFDAVPAFNLDDGTTDIVIADTEQDTWEPSNTYTLIDTIAARNQACDGRFVRQVRMAKEAAHNCRLDQVLPGLHVETFAFDAVTIKMEHDAAVAAIFAAGVTLLDQGYFDPTGVDRLSGRLVPGERAVARTQMERLAGRAQEALERAAAGDEGGACSIWFDVFGAAFPRPGHDTEASFIKGLYVGGGANTGRRTPTTRAWRLP